MSTHIGMTSIDVMCDACKRTIYSSTRTIANLRADLKKSGWKASCYNSRWVDTCGRCVAEGEARMENAKPMDVQEILNETSYRDWTFQLATVPAGYQYLQVRFRDEHGLIQKGRKWLLSEHMTRSEIVQTAMMAVLACEEHETRERFRYRGRTVFGPHFDVEMLAQVSDCLDVRPDIFTAAQISHEEKLKDW